MMTQALNALNISSNPDEESFAKRPPPGSKLAVRTTVLATLDYAPQILPRRQNSTATFLVWRSLAGARLTIHPGPLPS
jgi:hypothetical protein